MSQTQNPLTTLYNSCGIHTTKLIHVWYGPRSKLTRLIRKFDKNCYDLISARNVKFVKDHPEHGAYGSYNLFRPTSLAFHLIHEGDHEADEFIEALIGYTTVDEISLPRALGGGCAPRLLPLDDAQPNRVPVIIMIDSDTDMDLGALNRISEFIFSVPVATLLGP